MKTLPDQVLNHLRDVGDWPDLTGTRYEVIEKIGQGGMGTVYRTRDTLLDRLVALKVLNLDLDPSQLAGRLTREAQILGALEHPGIVPVHDLGFLPDGRVFYVMKLVNGARVDDYVSGTRLLSEKLQVFLKICEAVSFAHSLGIVHRDLKPQNVMIGPYGEVLVLDWGVAGFLESLRDEIARPEGDQTSPGAEKMDRTVEGTVMGTPGYMSPEQAAGTVREINERTDVYSLGAILYFLLTGKHPEPVNRVGPLMIRPEGVPKPLQAVYRKATAPDQANRYPDIRTLAEDVQRYLAGIRVTAYPETVWDTILRVTAKYRTPILLVLAYLVMRVVLLLWSRA
ncbi:MAG: serine/threonine protein kinase [Acidobacteria bacterium]|nr:MAG: serine/threonine protein kinase [Acidobacteriota bacterium]